MRPNFFRREVDDLFHLLQIRDIAFQAHRPDPVFPCYRLCHGNGPLFVGVGDDYRSPFLCQRPRNSLADTRARCRRDQCHLLPESHDSAFFPYHTKKGPVDSRGKEGPLQGGAGYDRNVTNGSGNETRGGSRACRDFPPYMPGRYGMIDLLLFIWSFYPYLLVAPCPFPPMEIDRRRGGTGNRRGGAEVLRKEDAPGPRHRPQETRSASRPAPWGRALHFLIPFLYATKKHPFTTINESEVGHRGIHRRRPCPSGEDLRQGGGRATNSFQDGESFLGSPGEKGPADRDSPARHVPGQPRALYGEELPCRDHRQGEDRPSSPPWTGSRSLRDGS